MSPDPQPIRVKSLIRMLAGEDPSEFMLRLTDAGYNRFYIHVPDGFRCDFKEPGYLSAHRLRREEDGVRSSIRHHGEPSYLQLDEQQVQKLIEHPPVALYFFEAGALFRRLRTDRRPSIEFDHQSIRNGMLEPKGRAAADATPTASDTGLVGCKVVKTLRPSSNMYSYFLHGVDFKDIYVEEAALAEALSTACASEMLGASVCGDMPDDPYGLEDSSPLVFMILCKAYQNRGKTRDEIDVSALAAEFRKLNATYKKNPKPFNDRRHVFAAHLSNPCYSYSGGGLRDIGRPDKPIEVPSDAFFEQEFINANFRKLLFAACCWSGAMDPGLGSDREKLVDLLIGLGFYDTGDDDQVQSLVHFIIGERYRRKKNRSDFRHCRADRV